jgi:hypothetical protein
MKIDHLKKGKGALKMKIDHLKKLYKEGKKDEAKKILEAQADAKDAIIQNHRDFVRAYHRRIKELKKKRKHALHKRLSEPRSLSSKKAKLHPTLKKTKSTKTSKESTAATLQRVKKKLTEAQKAMKEGPGVAEDIKQNAHKLSKRMIDSAVSASKKVKSELHTAKDLAKKVDKMKMQAAKVESRAEDEDNNTSKSAKSEKGQLTDDEHEAKVAKYEDEEAEANKKSCAIDSQGWQGLG